MKKNAHLSDDALEQIYLKELRNVVVDNDIPLADVDTVVTSFEKMESCLRKRRGKSRPKLPKSLREVSISGDYLLTVKGERFVLYSKGNKIIVFCSPTGLKFYQKVHNGTVMERLILQRSITINCTSYMRITSTRYRVHLFLCTDDTVCIYSYAQKKD